MGKALYRQYRPKKLSDVVGQKHITDTLTNALSKGAIAHAYLFTGPRGVGKTSIARILAHEINDLRYDEETTHLDIIEIDAASNRRIDEIRDLREKVQIAPTSARYKVYIIDEVHMLTREAFNALLKTLEEPPSHAVFILATTEYHKLPETIVSRTQRFAFKPIEKTDAISHLRTIADTENIAITDEALQLLADHGRGSFRDSISMLDQLTGLGEAQITATMLQELLGIPSSELLEDVLAAVVNNDTDLLFATTTKLRTQGAHPGVVAQSLIAQLRNNLVSGTNTFEHTSAVKLMKELLPLTGSANSFEALEIILLNNISFTNSTKNTSKKDSVAVVQESKSDTATNAAKLLQREDIKKADEIYREEKALPSGDWVAVLEALKGHHNTLYGVLRMAKANYSNGRLTLEFQFAFHHKQATQAKHLTILRETGEKIFGTPLEIITETAGSKKTERRTEKDNEVKNTINLENISNIFGGAELLES